MKHQFLNEAYTQQRQQHLIRAAADHRLARTTQVYRPGLAGRILGAVGGWMVTEGSRLQTRYQASGAGRRPGRVPQREIMFS